MWKGTTGADFKNECERIVLYPRASRNFFVLSLNDTNPSLTDGFDAWPEFAMLLKKRHDQDPLEETV